MSSENKSEEQYIFPTSFAQQRLWFLDQFEPGSPFYNIPTAVKIYGRLETNVLEDTLDEIIFRHESLRTTFAEKDGYSVQIIHPESDFNLEKIDISALSTKEREHEALRLAQNEARKPFDLTKGPLLRATLITLSEESYMMLVTMHHIISDGWSVSVFMREISAIYKAFSKDLDVPLPELPIQYADFSKWQRDWLKGAVLDAQLNYWKEALKQCSVLELPLDKPRPAMQSAKGASTYIHLPQELKEGINNLARKEGITPFMAYLSAFFILLNKQSLQEDITIGTPIANRTQSQTEALIGFFINTLVIRADLSGDPTFKTFAQQVRTTTLNAYAHQDLPFEMLVEAIQPERSMSHSPLFQVMFILQNATQNTPVQEHSDVVMEQVVVDAGTSTFDITVSLTEQPDGVSFSLEYCTELFEADTMQRFMEQYQTILQAITAAPETPISLIPVLNSKAKETILKEWNATTGLYDYKIPFHTLFERRCEESPQNIALIAPDLLQQIEGLTQNFIWTRLSYSQLNKKANQLARILQQNGVKAEAAVGVLLYKSWELMVAVLAILKAGGGYVPMDPAYPEDRLQHMMEDGQTPVIITHSELSVPSSGHNAVVLNIDRLNLSEQSESNLNLPVDPQNMAYMIYTSGTTGKSKGTIISHQNWVNSYYAWEQAYTLLDQCRSHLQMANFSFDVFAGDTIRALGSGGKLSLVPQPLLLDAPNLYRLMCDENVDIAEFVPAVLRNLTAWLDKENKNLHFMQCLIAGSDAWYVGEYLQFLKYGGEKTRLINSFGLTEASIDSTYFEARNLRLPHDRHVPIGIPFSNMHIYILDTAFQPVPIGVPGEIYVGGAGLARGYHNRPDLTAEKFVPHPFANKAGARLYRTGDKGKFLADGNIEFMGRIDHQVKLRGFRIEMGEIEANLARHETIKETSIIVREDTPGDKRLVAYYVLNQGFSAPSLKELKLFLLEKLPDYMIPNAFVALKKIPLTPNGKIDRKNLPQPDDSAYGSGEKYVAPRNETETTLCSIWATVLKVEQVGIHHNFFDLGGHSLLATQLVSRMREAFETEIALRYIFEFPTVALLVEKIAVSERNALAVAPPILATSRTEKLPLSFAQQRLWFLDQLEPNSSNYNIPEAARIRGAVSEELLQNALQLIIERHEILRTNFVDEMGTPRLEICKKRIVPFEKFDFTMVATNKLDAEINIKARQFAQTHFNLSSGPLLRIGWAEISKEESVLFVTIHHIISDEWSTQVFIRELTAIYQALQAKEESPLPALPIQYADFAVWQQQWLQGTVLEQQLTFWQEKLSAVPPVLELPTDLPRPKMQTFNGAFSTFHFSKELTEKIYTFINQHDITTFMLLLSAFQTLLYRYSGQQTFNIGTPVANRNRVELEPLIGFFVNTLVLPVWFENDTTFNSLLGQTKETALEAFAHQDLPFEKIVDHLNIERNLSHSPLFQTMFVLQQANKGAKQSGSNNIEITPVSAHSGAAKFDLTLFMVDDGTEISGAFEYNIDLFKKETIQQLITHFETLLLGLIKSPDKPVLDIALLTQQESEQILHQHNRFNKIQPLKGDIVSLFETQVQKTPNATAVEWLAGSLDYKTLNNQANQLCKTLLEEKGPVALYFKRAPEMIIALIAALKSGRPYLPLDPNYPNERLSYMLKDAQVQTVLSHSALPAINAQLNTLNVDQITWDNVLIPNKKLKRNADDLAYIIYTSGSTGKPKGTQITHGGLLHYLNWCQEAYQLDKGRGSLIHSTIAFDATVTALFTPFLNGKSITLATAEDDLEALSKALLHFKDFTLVKITPAHLDLLRNQIPVHKAAGLTHSFVIGGENLTSNQIAFWQQHAPNSNLFNEYGPTETVVGCVVYNAQKWQGTGSVPIGNAITNAPVYVLDAALNPVPQGVTGQLYISGAGMARGYLNRPDLSAEKFLPDPYSKQAGTRMYASGDLVRWQGDKLLFVGRIDDQVKIRGHRIELGEIEAVMRTIPTLNDCLVMVREDIGNEKQIVAYWVANTEEDETSSSLKNILKAELPEYMQPAFFIKMDAIPLTPNGKVNRSALPKPKWDRSLAKTQFIAPEGDEEKKLATIWQEVLTLPQVGVHDSFFELGGHSLMATQLIARVRDAFNVELPVRALFEAPTIALFAQQLQNTQAHPQNAVPPLSLRPKNEEIMLSFAQQRLWFLDQLNPNSAQYNIPSAFKLNGPLDKAALEKTINAIIKRHEVFRYNFKNLNGEPQLIIHPKRVFKPTWHDISNMPNTQQLSQIKQMLFSHATQSFNLQTDPLFAITILKVDAQTHIIMLNLHHIISDGWSTQVLMNEIGHFYNAFSTNKKATLHPLSVQYSDYAWWQRNWLKDKELQRQLNYWQQRLGNNPAPLNMPLDYPRPANQTYNGATYTYIFSKPLTQQLKALAQTQNSTLFMLLLSAWQLLLHKYSGDETIYVGSPIANRRFTQTEALIGFFVNTLVFRADVDTDQDFAHFLEAHKEHFLQAYAHQDIPFEQLVDTLQTRRDSSHAPLFQVMFVLQSNKQHTPDASHNTLSFEALESDAKVAKFDFTLSMIESEEQLAGEVEYNTDLFKPNTIKTLINRFTFLLEQITTQPQLKIADLCLMDSAEQDRTWSPINKTQVPATHAQTMNTLFEQTVQEYGNKTALTFYKNGQVVHYTFNTLNAKANHLAMQITKLGLPAESFVGISVQRSAEMVIALLAVIKAGAVYVPIDPSYPKKRIDYILDDAGIDLLLLDNATQIETDIPKRTIDADSLTRGVANPNNAIAPQQLAYMIYTSGSTGKPKGTMVQHQSLCNLTLFQIKDFNLTAKSKCLQFASFSFDASVSEIFTTLVSGAELIIGTKEQLLPGPELVKLLKEHAVSVVTLPPSVSALLREEDFPALKTLISAGEALAPELANHWQKNRRLVNAYGPTENTVCASSFIVNQPYSGKSLPIGKPIDNVQLYIIDKHAHLQPEGVVGELAISGASLARGYFNRPDLTAEKFIPNPWAKTAGARLYKTGDLARLLPDGNIEFIGRMDHQVKVRGFRIELGEIEQTLMDCPHVSDATVQVHNDANGNAAIVAYFIGSENEQSDIRAFMQTALPNYMQPNVYMALKQFPLTVNGKIDTQALPKPQYKREAQNRHIAPRNAQEEKIAAIWQELLSIKDISVNDNFFELGGHSLIATQLVSRLQKTFNKTVQLTEVFAHPTVAELSMHIESIAYTSQNTPAIKKVDYTQPIPLSFAQQRLWFLDKLRPANAMYNLPSMVELHGTLNTKILQKTINTIAERHAILRTSFATQKGKAVQIINAKASIPLQQISLQHLPEQERSHAALKMAEKEMRYPFNLEKDTLLRFALIAVNTQKHILVMNMHHIISDGWSMGILVRELLTIYQSLEQKQPNNLAHLPFQYADIAVWQRTWLSGEIYNKQLSYWQEKLKGSTPLLNLPYDRPRPAVQTYNGKTISFKLQHYTQLKQLSKELAVTPFMVLLATFKILLAHYSGQDDISIGTPIANRNRKELEEIIGFFVNTLVLHDTINQDETFSDFLKQVRQTTLNAYAHQDIPFESIVDAVAPNREMSYTPLFQVMFVMQNTPETVVAQESALKLVPVDGESKFAKFDLTLTLAESPNGFSGSAEFNSDLFDSHTIEAMLHHFNTLLGAVLNNPQQPLKQYTLLSSEEAHAVTQIQNSHTKSFPSGQTLHSTFEKAVEKHPNNIALRYEHKDLSYHQLNQMANKLARYLTSQNVQEGDLVGLTVERNIEMVISILAILKAGAGYVPLDPAYPKERLTLIIGSARPKWIITSSNLKEKIPQNSAQMIWLDKIEPQLEAQKSNNLNRKIDINTTAYIIYTSGSTGTPKGVMVSHANVSRLFKATEDWFHFNEKDIWTFFHSYAFDFSVWELWGALLYGGKIVIVPYLVSRSPQQFHSLLLNEGVTVLNQTPSAFGQLSAVEMAQENTSDFNLRYIIFGGDTLTLENLRPWFNRFGDSTPQLINMYGITETTVHVTYRPITLSDLDTASGSMIGVPIPDLQLYVLNAALAPCPIGVPGEIYVGGAGVTAGYYQQLSLTDERFISNPFGNGKLYKTGDSARLLANGDLEYLGRIDHQVQLRGFRVELGEIEHAIAKHEAVQETLVLLHEASASDKKLIAYIVPTKNSKPTITQLRSFIQQYLPDYMVPTAFVILQEFPLTAHGKIDRRNLPAPQMERTQLGTEFVAATTGNEKILCTVWQTILNQNKIGINDNFFDLGGDSILMIQSIALAKEKGLYITPTQVFQNPTVSRLARVAEDATAYEQEQGIISGTVPLTPIQNWFFHHHQQHPEQFNTSMMMALFQKEPLNRKHLIKAVELLTKHHDIFRAQYTKTDGQWQQIILEELTELPVHFIDLSHLRKGKQSQQIEQEAARIQESFNLHNAPLFNITFFECGNKGPSKLLFVFHHLLVDGVSWRFIVDDFVHIFSAVSQEKEPALAPKSTSYQKWANALYAHAQTEQITNQWDYWKNVYATPLQQLKADNPKGTNSYGTARALTVSLAQPETEKLLRDVPKKYGSQVNDILLLALMHTLKQFHNIDKTIIELEGHGREDIIPGVDLSHTVGWFTSIFPVALTLNQQLPLQQQLQHMRATLNAVPNHGIGFNMLKYLTENSHIRDSLTALPHAEVNFNYLGQFGAEGKNEAATQMAFGQAKESVGPEQHPNDKRSALLYLVAVVNGEQLHTRWLYSKDMFKESSIKKWAEFYLKTLTEFVKTV